MPRKARIDAPGALHHIIARGIEKRKIFLDDFDRNSFVERLGTVLKESQTPCFAWALLPNHLHLLVRTGRTPIATVMRRLLTSHAVRFNRRHRRHGHLFQNRYKSILCQEDLYFLELVRYIHLNPLRSKLVKNYQDLSRFAYCGHSILMAKRKNDWQDIDYVLALFDNSMSKARRRYSEFVKKGISQGRRSDLVGGGLIRSLGGWSVVKALQGMGDWIKGDERILGDGDFVESVLKNCHERLKRHYHFQARGYDFNWLVAKVARLMDMEKSAVIRPGKYPDTVIARSVLCYWAARELGISTRDLSKRLGISQPTASQSIRRGEKIVVENGLKLVK